MEGEISLNTWHFAAVTYDGTTVKVYVDGEERSNGTPSLDTNGANKSNFYIAKRNSNNYGGYFKGIIVVFHSSLRSPWTWTWKGQRR